MSEVQNRKEILRQQFLSYRDGLTEEEYYNKSGTIINRLEEDPDFRQSRCVHCYVSMNDRREVNTRSMIQWMLNSRFKVAVPITNFDDGTLTHVQLDSYDELEENQWGVPEPPRKDPVDLDALDLVIVPMAGGDERCNRIGYGKGFYDRFLQEVSCPTIGLTYEECMVDELPVEEFDVPLSKIITEDRVIGSS